MCRLAFLSAVVVLALVAPPLTAAAADGPKVSYRPPVDAPIVDPFRPPANRWDSGNRGVDYAPGAGTPVKAAADGEVAFAGSVGGRLHVVVLHADGIRTSYSFLASVGVHRGDRLRQGDVVGVSGDHLHFGARLGDDYIDPTTLFDTGPPKVFLVPDELRRPGTVAAERAGLVRQLGPTLARALWGVTRPGRTVVGAAVREAGNEVLGAIDEARGILHYAHATNPATQAWNMVRHTVAWYSHRHDCTPASVPPPPRPGDGRVAVLVAGLGSNHEAKGADVVEVDPAAMGYARHLRFSYTGGSTETSDYTGRDTTGDLRQAGRRFAELLEQVQRDNPGRAVDIIAHSQGGLVARTALAYDYDSDDGRYPKVANLITLGAPHQGAEAATALMIIGRSGSGEYLQEAIDSTRIIPFDLRGESVRQMSETSWFLTMLNRKPLPDGIRFTSIGDRGDLVVPAVHTAAPGARNVVVSGPSAWKDHSGLPGSEAGRREVALAAAGLPPTCESFREMVTDYTWSSTIAFTEDLLGAGLYAGGRYVDRFGVRKPPVAIPTRRKP